MVKGMRTRQLFLWRNVGEEKLYKCPKELCKLLTSEVATVGCPHRLSDLRGCQTLALFGTMQMASGSSCPGPVFATLSAPDEFNSMQ